MKKVKLAILIFAIAVALAGLYFYVFESIDNTQKQLGNKNRAQEQALDAKGQEITGEINEIFSDERRIVLYPYNKEKKEFADEIEVLIVEGAEILVSNKKDMVKYAEEIKEYNKKIEGLSDKELKEIEKPSAYISKKEKIGFDDLEKGQIIKTSPKQTDSEYVSEKIEVLSQTEAK